MSSYYCGQKARYMVEVSYPDGSRNRFYEATMGSLRARVDLNVGIFERGGAHVHRYNPQFVRDYVVSNSRGFVGFVYTAQGIITLAVRKADRPMWV